MKSICEKYKSPENCVFVPPKVNLELWKLLSSWQRKGDIKFVNTEIPSEDNECISKYS